MKRSGPPARRTELRRTKGLDRVSSLKSLTGGKGTEPTGKVDATNRRPGGAVNTPGPAPEVGPMQHQGNRRGTGRVCQECGAEFVATRDCATRTSKYCSPECGWSAQKRKAAESLPARDELVRLHHTEGMTVAAVARHYGKSDWWVKRTLTTLGVEIKGRPAGGTKQCVICGADYYAAPSKFAERKYCSHKCRGKGEGSPAKRPGAAAKIAAAKMGPKNPAWRGKDTEGSIYRVFSVGLKGETCCRNCGKTGLLHLHHIVPRSLCKAGRRDMRNGVTLCPTCHHGWHHKLITLHREILTADEWAFVSSLELTGRRIEAWLDDHYPSRPTVVEQHPLNNAIEEAA